MIVRPLRRLIRSNRGTAAIEFALVVPVMILLIAGVVELGTIIKVYNGTDRLASQFAIAWSDCSDYPAGSCQTELTNYTTSSIITNIAPQLVPANTTVTMFQVTMSGTNPVVSYSYPMAASLSAAQIATARATFTDKQVGVIVSVTYQHSLNFFSSTMATSLTSKLNPSYTVAQLKS